MASAWSAMKERLFGHAQIEEVSSGKDCCPRSIPLLSGVGALMVEPWGPESHRFVDLGQVRLLAFPGTARGM